MDIHDTSGKRTARVEVIPTLNRKQRRAQAVKHKKEQAKQKEALRKLIPMGYSGQEYEVTFNNGQGKRMIIGWTNNPTGGALVGAIERHPAFCEPEVKKLTEEEKATLRQAG